MPELVPSMKTVSALVYLFLNTDWPWSTLFDIIRNWSQFGNYKIMNMFILYFQKDTSHLRQTSDLWGICREDQDEKWPGASEISNAAPRVCHWYMWSSNIPAKHLSSPKWWGHRKCVRQVKHVSPRIYSTHCGRETPCVDIDQVQVLACCMASPSYVINQCWLITGEVLQHLPEGSFTWNAHGVYPW